MPWKSLVLKLCEVLTREVLEKSANIHCLDYEKLNQCVAIIGHPYTVI